MDRTVLVYSRNGSLEVTDEDILSPLASGVIIVICFLLAVCYNILVIGAVISNNKLRHSPFHIVLSVLSLISLLDCITNESLAFGFLFDFNPKVCITSAVTFHLFLLTHSATLTLLFLERTLELQEHVVSVRMALGGALSTWIFGIIFTSTLLVSSDIHFFPNRNACGFVKLNNVWPIIVYVLGFCVCWVATTTAFFLCVRSIRVHNEEQNLTISSVLSTLTDADLPSPLRPLVNSNQNKLLFTIMFIYIILLLPQVIYVTVNLFIAPTFEPDPWVDPRVSGQVKSVTTNSLEPLLVYSRYVYNAVLPIIILINDKQTRMQSRRVFCCRWNEVSSLESSERIVPAAGFDEYSQVPNKPYDLRIPVLFATSEGLNLRLPQNNSTPADSERLDMAETSLTLVTKLCDFTVGLSIEGTSILTKPPSPNEVVPPEVNIPEVRRNVRFSSKVNEIMLESGVSSNSSGQGSSLSTTHTVNIPLFVKSECDFLSEPRESFSKV